VCRPQKAQDAESEHLTLTPEQIADVQYAYQVIAEACAERLWSPAGAYAVQYLLKRGLSKPTIRAAGLGLSDEPTRLFEELWRHDSRAYRGALFGGLRKRQAVPRGVMIDTIIIPYRFDGRCVLVRGRKLHPQPDAPKYLSPACPLYSGAEPRFYLHDVLADTDQVILTEGEFKALAAHQAWIDGRSPMPCAATAGISCLPNSLIACLRGKTVYLAFDSEDPRPGAKLSPGDAATLKHGARLRKQGINVQVLTLPRPAGVAKMNLDSYLLAEEAA
jgi:DNA primase